VLTDAPMLADPKSVVAARVTLEVDRLWVVPDLFVEVCRRQREQHAGTGGHRTPGNLGTVVTDRAREAGRSELRLVLPLFLSASEVKAQAGYAN